MEETIGRILLLTHLTQLFYGERKECAPTRSDCAGENQENTEDDTTKDGVRNRPSGGCYLQRKGREIV
ncbi:hypothetical protein T231_09230 [Tannerella sp. oral taxon BU063 isolate Cell 6/7/9]|uniref:Uncharacterized protein n=1 Tax=Tannerella sp. oral taxon BU063 isolate Cell 6/7/9 TaxID=1411021 RepID=W2CSN8_9BACT|nr:hypothetical protein T231_12815 [Tannerella sp. oral taxon BU063 isolate Cell 6/7/9]ETK09541.1 hypothetical protein T231_09230 [Tannerella sp. oral taxon BU063 isolate Cell 6/7/9]